VLTLVEISKVPVVPAVIVKFLSVEADAPVYFKVPPPNTRLVAALVAEPKLPLATAPSPIVATLSVPALIVVTPVKVFAPDKVNVPAPAFVTAKAVEPS